MEVFHTIGWLAGWVLFAAILAGYLVSIFTDRDYLARRGLASVLLVAILILLLADLNKMVQHVFF